jgi:hypothetical protein
MKYGFAGAAVGLGIGLAVCVEPMPAHHSIVAEYNLSNSITIQGTVTKVEWMNPHARFYLSVAEADGRMVDWEIEMGSPNVLMKDGWTRDTIKPGDQISVDALEAKDGTKLGYARAVTWPDGRILSVPLDNWGMPIPK